jgi:hypothetical protein
MCSRISTIIAPADVQGQAVLVEGAFRWASRTPVPSGAEPGVPAPAFGMAGPLQSPRQTRHSEASDSRAAEQHGYRGASDRDQRTLGQVLRGRCAGEGASGHQEPAPGRGGLDSWSRPSNLTRAAPRTTAGQSRGGCPGFPPPLRRIGRRSAGRRVAADEGAPLAAAVDHAQAQHRRLAGRGAAAEARRLQGPRRRPAGDHATKGCLRGRPRLRGPSAISDRQTQGGAVA